MRRHNSPSYYPSQAEINDPVLLERVIRRLYDESYQLRSQVGMAEDKISNLRIPTFNEIRSALQANGSTPISLDSLTGQASEPQLAALPYFNAIPAPDNFYNQDGQGAAIYGIPYRFFAGEPGNWRPLGGTTWLNVRSFGAIGDGVTDDTAAIQAAFDAIDLLNYSTIYFPTGSYLITAEISVLLPCTVLGDGPRKSIVIVGNAAGHVAIHGFHVNVPVPDVNDKVEQVAFYDLKIQTTAIVKTAGAGILFESSHATNWSSNNRIYNVHFKGQFRSVWLRECAATIIDSCVFWGETVNGDGVLVENTINGDAGDNSITNCMFVSKTASDGRFAIRQISAGGLRVENNKFLGYEYQYYGDFNSVATGQIYFVGNSFDLSRNINLRVGVAGGTVPYGVVISGNLFAVNTGITGIGIDNAVTDGVVSGNLILTYGAPGTGTGINFVNAVRFHTSGNVFTNLLLGVGIGASCSNVILGPNIFPGCTTNVTNSAGTSTANCGWRPGHEIYSTHTDRLAALHDPTKYYPGVTLHEHDREATYMVKVSGVTYVWRFNNGFMTGVHASLPADLGTADIGFLYRDTEYGHVYQWSGSAWTFAGGDPGSGWIAASGPVAPSGQWAYCDGSGTTIANADGTTLAVTTPNLTGETFVRGGGYTGPTATLAARAKWEAAARTEPEAAHTHSVDVGSTTSDGGTSHTHSVDPVEFTSGLNSANNEVQAGTGGPTAAANHTHQIDVPSTTSGPESAHTHNVDPVPVTSGVGSSHSHVLNDTNALLKTFSVANGGLPNHMGLNFWMRR